MLITLVDEEFFLCAEDEKDKDEWIAQLGRAIIHHSSMFCGTIGDLGYRSRETHHDSARNDEKDRSTATYANNS